MSLGKFLGDVFSSALQDQANRLERYSRDSSRFSDEQRGAIADKAAEFRAARQRFDEFRNS